jgi:hypothetical protein
VRHLRRGRRRRQRRHASTLREGGKGSARSSGGETGEAACGQLQAVEARFIRLTKPSASRVVRRWRERSADEGRGRDGPGWFRWTGS